MRKRTDDRERREFLQRLRRALDYAGISQNELGRRVGQSPQGVSDWFTRQVLPGGEVMIRLPKVLGVSGHWLLTNEGTMTPGGEGGISKAFEMGARAAFSSVRDAVSQAEAEWGAQKPESKKKA